MSLRRAACFLGLCGFGILLPTSLGCGKRQPVATTASAAPGVATGNSEQDRQTSQQFVATLKAIPPEQRLAFMQAHPTETKLAAQSPDTDVRQQFQQAAFPSGK